MRPWQRLLPAALLALLPSLAAPAAAAAPPDYSGWQALLAKYYDPARGMNYKALKAQDAATLAALRARLATVDVQALPRPDQLAYWIDLYNVSVVGIVVDRYPVASIRDLSTDPIVRLNVFKKDSVPTREGALSLDRIENEKIREAFKDPRIHFAINCAAASCPPIRPEPYVGARIDPQLDDQARNFLNGPHGVRLGRSGAGLVLHVTKILDWFKADFESWGGGRVAFLRKYLSPEKQKLLDAAGGKVDLQFDAYDWKLNDTSK
jgi:uncharacterized protein DUF547